MDYLTIQYGTPCPLRFFDPAFARIIGGHDYPGITGVVFFRDVQGGTEVCADITGLPPYRPISRTAIMQVIFRCYSPITEGRGCAFLQTDSRCPM